MSKIITVGVTALFAGILCATPLSVRLSPQGTVALFADGASAEIGRPLSAGSVAGVHRRAHRRAYRRGYYGNYGYGYGTSQPSYGSGYAYRRGTTVTMDTGTSRRTDMDTRISLGMAPGTGNGGSSDRAISIMSWREQSAAEGNLVV